MNKEQLLKEWLEEKIAHIIEWEFPDFDVEKCLANLYHAQEVLEKNGVIEGRIHRFLYVAQK